MTVQSLLRRNDYTGSGTTGPFPYTFPIFAATDLAVTVRDTLTGLDTGLAYPTDFAVSGVGLRTGGAVTLTDAIASTDLLSIRRVLPVWQPVEFRSQGAYNADRHEKAFDRLAMIAQQHDDALARSLSLAEVYDPASYDLRLPAPSPGAAVVWNVEGTGFDNAALSDAQLSAWSAAQNQKLDTFVGGTHFTAGTSTTLQLTDPPGDIANVHLTRRTSGAVVPVLTDEYAVDDTGLITFVAPIPTGTTRVEARYFQTYQVNTALARNVRLTLGGGRTIPSLERYLVNGQAFNVKDFAATGDGLGDDYAAFAAAITAARAAGGYVFVPYSPNYYKISATLVLGSAALAFVPLVGDASCPQLRFSGANGFLLDCSGNDINTAVECGLLSNLRLYNAVANLTSGCIKAYFAYKLRGLNLTLAANGIALECNETISTAWTNCYMQPATNTVAKYGKRGFARNFVWHGGRIYGAEIAIEGSGESHSFDGVNIEFCTVVVHTRAVTTMLFDNIHVESCVCLLTNADTIPLVNAGGGNWVDNGSTGIGAAGGIRFVNCHIPLAGYSAQTNLVVLKNQVSFTYELIFEGGAITHTNLRIGGSFTPGATTAVPAGTAVKLLGRGPGAIACTVPLDAFSLLVRDNTANVYLRNVTSEGLQTDIDGSSGNTRLLVYDVAAGAFVRVSRGAADSAGSGYRALRIPN